MIRLVWLNRFLALLIVLLFLFVMTVGSIIVNENRISAEPTWVDRATFMNELTSQQHIETPTINKTYSPAPASASSATQRFYAHLDARKKQNIYIQPTSKQSSTFNEGYNWAKNHTIQQASQCQHLSNDSLEGCHAFLEVANYVQQAQPNLNL